MMSSSTVQVTDSGAMGMYEAPRSMSMWRDAPLGYIASTSSVSNIPTEVADENKFECEYPSHQILEPSITGEDARRLSEKVQRRLAQNREAARKSRLRKKAYVEQLESSRLKLAQLEQELHKVKLQGLFKGTSMHPTVGYTGNINSGITSFEIEYVHWVEEQNRINSELRRALQANNVSDVELQILIESALKHYYNLFQMKADAARTDVFYLMSGSWRTPMERFFLWIGGFRPSELLNILMPQISPSPQQEQEINKLRQCSLQAEEALSRGIDKLQVTLTQVMFADALGIEMYGIQMATALEKLEAIEGFVNQADNLREQTLQLMSRILDPRQACRGLLGLGDYFDRLRALSSLWATCPRNFG